MRPAFNLEPKYSVTVLTREEWTKGPRTHPVVEGLVWFTDWSRMKERTGSGIYGQYLGRRVSISLGKYAIVFQADMCLRVLCLWNSNEC